MFNKYEVEQTKQASGIMFAVIFNGNYRFLKKTAKEANSLAEKLNKIHQRKLDSI